MFFSTTAEKVDSAMFGLLTQANLTEYSRSATGEKLEAFLVVCQCLGPLDKTDYRDSKLIFGRPLDSWVQAWKCLAGIKALLGCGDCAT
jgi:hypothetical protein